MNKKIIGILSLLGITLLAGCSNDDVTNSQDNGNSTEPSISENDNGTSNQSNKKQYKVGFSEINKYIANVGCASSLGISKNVTTTLNSNSYGINLMANPIETVNHLYMTKYENPDVSVNDGLIEVTFKRIITDNITTTIQGEDYYVPYEENNKLYLSFPATKNFEYSISGANFSLSEVIDNDVNDLDRTENVIKIEIGNIDNTSTTNKTTYVYEVSYTGVGREEVVTQEEIGGKIENFYVDSINNVTYISYVPRDFYGRAPEGYYSDNFKQSFIINNNTGLIYKIEDVTITELANGLIKCSDGFIYDFRINDKNEYELYPICGNKEIEVSKYFKDRYGYKYIVNNILETFDSNTNTVFTKSNKYQYTNEGYILYLENNLFLDYDYIYLMTGYNKYRNINDEDYFSYVDKRRNEAIVIYRGYCIVNENSGYDYGHSSDYDAIEIWKLKDSEKTTSVYCGGVIFMQFALFDGEAVTSAEQALKYLIDYNVAIRYSNNKVYVLNNIFDDLVAVINDGGGEIKYESGVEKLSGELVLENVNNYSSENGIATVGAFGTTYYEIVVTKDKTGNVSYDSYVKGTYKSPAKTIVLQPINR